MPAFQSQILCFLYRTDFEYLQEVPVLTLDVNEDFKSNKDKHENMIEKVKAGLFTLCLNVVSPIKNPEFF